MVDFSPRMQGNYFSVAAFAAKEPQTLFQMQTCPGKAVDGGEDGRVGTRKRVQGRFAANAAGGGGR